MNKPTSYSINMLCGLVALTDALILISSGLGIYSNYLGLDSPNYWLYTLGIIFFSLLVILVFYHHGLYSISSIFDPIRQIKKILGIISLAFLVFLALAFAFKVTGQLSRVWLFSWFLTSLPLLWLIRRIYRVLFIRLTKVGKFSRKIVIVGYGNQAKNFLNSLEFKNEPWIHVVGIFDDRKSRIESSFLGFPVLGTLDDLLEYCRNNQVDDIIVTLPWNADMRLLDIFEKLEELPIHVCLSSDLSGFLRFRKIYNSISGIPMLEVNNKPIEGLKYIAKVLEDKILGLTLLILLSPLMLMIALILKLEKKGPVLFQQKRLGFNNKPFMVLKFRSMFHKRTKDIGSAQATRNDSRVTPFGKFLRHSSLDELPQLFNVLGGTMSLVGPRPHPVALDDEFSPLIKGYFARHRVKPGITGWAQVNGLRGETDIPAKMLARVKHDIHYIENWSIFFDLKILIKTLIVGLYHENAY